MAGSVFVLADDLSGAAETAAVLMSPARPARITLSGPPYGFAAPVVVADLDCRYRAGAGERVGEALRHTGDRRVFIKIDSLLRGNIAATVAATLHAATCHAATWHAASSRAGTTLPADTRDAAVSTAPPAGLAAPSGAASDAPAPASSAPVSSAPVSSAPVSSGAGPVASGVLSAGPGGVPLVVFASALPSAGRVVVGGVPYVGGLSLRETRTWCAEPGPAPGSVAEALGGAPSVLVPLATIRAGQAAVARALSRTAGKVAVCDAETDADLDTIAAAALLADPRARFIGAGGLAAALGRTLDPGPPPTATPDAASPDAAAPRAAASGTAAEVAAPGDAASGAATSRVAPGAVASRAAAARRPLLVVVGTAEPGAAEQARLLLARGARPVVLDAAADLAPARRAHTVRRLRDALAATTAPAVLTVTGQGPPGLAATLAEIVKTALTGHAPAPDLVLTGGETARRVLDALEIHELTPLGQIHHGAVHCHTPHGSSVVTRPGSFGDRDSLLRIAAHLAPERLT
ncbi:four-carbon acid sugar kinase family protein [Nonomuraea sp. MG754425]|uniref:four-carbon acid sugar kinase family protein n=1 Tax=Nonomuraea sp. MG754425 TaxID=2570319 RepID=UPI0023510BF8|nr:four-carbon acid sugar kinase family protein [Nonomuraea sp. MG754425]